MTVTLGPLWRLQPLQRHEDGDGDGDGDADDDDDGDDGDDDGDDGDDDADDDVYDGCYDGCRMHEHTHFLLMRIGASVQETQQAMLRSSGLELDDSQKLLIRFCIGSLGIVSNQPEHLQLSDTLLLDADVRVHQQFDQRDTNF